MPEKLLTGADRHLVGRFSYGVNQRLAKEVREQGGGLAWFERQLDAHNVPDAVGDRVATWWPHLWERPIDLWHQHEDGSRPGWVVMNDYERWTLVRRIESRRQVLETMTAFWETLFHVPTTGDAWFIFRPRHGKAIRSHALGTFEDLLKSAITHPAMLVYLDNAISTKAAPNENLGRELLELHTVGIGHYDEDDVKDSARILTGWRVDMWESWRSYYDHTAHARGRVRVMGFSDKNKKGDARDLTDRYLSYLAHHPATARRIARRLAVKFVGDDVSNTLVKHLAKVYRRNNTAIKPVLRALVRSSEFAASRGSKVKTPAEDVASTYRALDVGINKPIAPESAANAILYQCYSLGAGPLAWPRPDGQPVTDTPWTSSTRLLASLALHRDVAGGWWPNKQVKHRAPEDWLPSSTKKLRFDEFVDHLCHVLQHRHADTRLVEACSLAIGVAPQEQIDKDHDVIKWRMPVLLSTVLDAPEFFAK